MRDKNISVRVDSKLYEEFLKIVESKTEVYHGWGSRRIYNYRDPLLPYHYDKFTIADLVELALRKYIEERKK